MRPCIGFFPTNGNNPVTGYGKLELGQWRGLEAAGIEITSNAPVMLVTGNAFWLSNPVLRGKRVWLYTMSETTRISAEWVEQINQYAERVLVPCPGLIDIYQDSGVRVPVYSVGAGVDDHLPDYHRPARSETFTFLSYSLGDLRKGAELAIIAFKRLFAGNDKFKLIIKCRERDTWLSGCRDEQIEVVEGQLPEADWHALLHRVNCFVFPTRGEGWGKPPREATLAGLPTICTRWLGTWDVDRWGIPLTVKEMRPAHFDTWEANAEGALWAEPDSDDLERQMRWVVSHYDEAVQIAAQGRDYLLGNWTYRHFGERIAALLQEAVWAH